MTAKRPHGDSGSVSVGLVLLVVIAVAGAALIFDGARYLAAERHASNTAEGAARAAIATGSPADGLDADLARQAAIDHAGQLGVAATDVQSRVSVPRRCRRDGHGTTTGNLRALHRISGPRRHRCWPGEIGVLVTRTQAVAARVGACAALVALLVVPPVLVAMLIGRPYPQWSTLTDELDRGQVSTDTVMRIAALVFAAIWVWLTLTIATETFRLLRNRRIDPSNRRPAPPAVRGRDTFIHRLVRLAVLGTIATAATITTWPTPSLATTGRSLTADVDRPPVSAPVDPADTAPATTRTTRMVADGRATPLSIAVDLGDETLRDEIVALNRTATWTGGVFPAGTVVTIPALDTPLEPPTAPSDAGVYVVQPNDGLWNVAEALLGDGRRHHELRLLLDGQHVAPGVMFTADTDTIHPGWTFQLPSGVATPSIADGGVHVVEAGDTLSSISQHHLGTADRWSELWALNRHTVMPDGRTFDDPNLIVSGWHIHLPATPADDESLEPQPDPAPTTTTEPSQPPTDTTVAAPRDVTPPPPTPRINGLPAPTAPATDHPRTPATHTAPVPSDIGTADDASSATIFTDADRSVWPNVVAGTLLTAGLAALITRLRRRRLSHLPPGRRLRPPTNTAAGTEHALLTRTRQPGISTITALLRSITPHASAHGTPAVRAVQLGHDRIEVLFAKPAPHPPKGWSTIDGGHSWTHRLDDPVTEHRQLLTPALITIGARTDDNAQEVLLDIETAGTVAIAGDRNAAIGLARSIVYELASYPLGVSMDVNLIGLDVPGAEHTDRTWTDTTIDRATRVAHQRALRAHADGHTPIEQRAGLTEDDGSTAPQVFVIDRDSLDGDDIDTLDQLVTLCQPSNGMITIIVGDHPGTGERIVAGADGTGLWSGVDLALPDVTDAAAAEIEELLDDLANAETELIEPGDLLATLAPTTPASHGASNGDSPDPLYEAPPYDVLVRVMGEPCADGVDLTADETELLSLLTCLRHHTEIHIGLIHESVGPERARKTIENRMSILRRKLGVGSDGHDLLPEATPSDRGHSHYLVSPLVLTDTDLLEHRYHASNHLNSGDALTVLRDGIDLMRGPLLRARKGYEFWPNTEGVTATMTSVLQTYATRLIELAAQANDTTLIVTTTARASRVLDDPLAELPIRQIEQALSNTISDDRLQQSVTDARRRLLSHLDETDPLAESA